MAEGGARVGVISLIVPISVTAEMNVQTGLNDIEIDSDTDSEVVIGDD